MNWKKGKNAYKNNVMRKSYCFLLVLEFPVRMCSMNVIDALVRLVIQIAIIHTTSNTLSILFGVSLADS